MLEVLTNPNKFFEDRMKGEESLKIPALIALISGIITGISTFLITGVAIEMLSETIPPEAQGLALAIGGTIASIIALIIFLLLYWVGFAVLFFGISYIFKGEGQFKRTLEFVGYGLIPTIISGIISAVLIYNFISTTQIPQVSDPEMIEEILTLMMTQMMKGPTLIGILFMLWSANIWVFGLKHARNLSTKNAVITVAIPVGLYVLWTVYQMGVF